MQISHTIACSSITEGQIVLICRKCFSEQDKWMPVKSRRTFIFSEDILTASKAGVTGLRSKTERYEICYCPLVSNIVMV